MGGEVSDKHCFIGAYLVHIISELINTFQTNLFDNYQLQWIMLKGVHKPLIAWLANFVHAI